MKTAFVTVLPILASLAALRVSAQPVTSSETGTITHVDGKVYLDGRRMQPSVGEFPKITENSLMRTEDGRADVLLAAGVTLRLGENSSFRMIANRPGETQIEVLTGSAVVLTDEDARPTNPFNRRLAGRVTVVCENTVTLSNFSAYRFDNFQPSGRADARFCRFKVYKGTAAVQLASVSAILLRGEMMALNRACGDHVQVNEFDVDELSQPLAQMPALDIQGQLRAEDQGGARFEGLHVALVSRDFLRRDTNARQDGSFTFGSVFADRYAVRVHGLPEGHYVKSILMGDVDALEAGIDLTRGASAPLDILISPNGGQVEGSVRDARQQPAGGATVVLVPAPPHRRQSNHFKKAATDQYGHFTIKGVAPGDYKVFAWDRMEGAYQDSEFLYEHPRFVKPYENEGAAIAVREGSRESVELKLIRYVSQIR